MDDCLPKGAKMWCSLVVVVDIDINVNYLHRAAIPMIANVFSLTLSVSRWNIIASMQDSHHIGGASMRRGKNKMKLTTTHWPFQIVSVDGCDSFWSVRKKIKWELMWFSRDFRIAIQLPMPQPRQYVLHFTLACRVSSYARDDINAFKAGTLPVSGNKYRKNKATAHTITWQNNESKSSKSFAAPFQRAKVVVVVPLAFIELIGSHSWRLFGVRANNNYYVLNWTPSESTTVESILFVYFPANKIPMPSA